MSGLLKEILALTVKSEAALWKSVEQKVLSSITQLSRPDLVKITHHFGDSKQGSNDLWSQLDKAAVSVFPDLTVQETLDLIDGFGKSPKSYDLSQELDSRLVASWEQLGSLKLQQLIEKDPYIISEVVNQLDAAAPEHIKLRQKEDVNVRGFLNFFGVSSSITSTQSTDGPLRSQEEREAYIKEQAQKYLKENPQSQILDVIGQK